MSTKCQNIEASSKPIKSLLLYKPFKFFINTTISAINATITCKAWTKAIKKIKELFIVLVGPVKWTRYQ